MVIVRNRSSDPLDVNGVEINEGESHAIEHPASLLIKGPCNVEIENQTDAPVSVDVGGLTVQAVPCGATVSFVGGLDLTVTAQGA